MTINILVPVKRVVDANVRVRVSSNGSIDTTGLKMSLNPFDECAVEKALQLKEAGVASKGTVITCGTQASQDVLRTALAMGADDAVLIDTATATSTLESLAVARLLCQTAPARDDDTGTATWLLEGPAVVSADLRLADPRRVTLPSIVKAKQKPLTIVDAATLAIALTPQSHIVKLTDPPVRQPGIKVADSAALIAALTERRVFDQAGVPA